MAVIKTDLDSKDSIIPQHILEIIEYVKKISNTISNEADGTKEPGYNKDITDETLSISLFYISDTIDKIRALEVDESNQIIINNNIRTLTSARNKIKKVQSKRLAKTVDETIPKNEVNPQEAKRIEIKESNDIVSTDNPEEVIEIYNTSEKSEEIIENKEINNSFDEYDKKLESKNPKVTNKNKTIHVQTEEVEDKSKQKEIPNKKNFDVEIKNDGDDENVVNVTNESFESERDNQEIDIEMQENNEEDDDLPFVNIHNEENLDNIVFENSDKEEDKQNLNNINKIKEQLDTIKTVSLASTNSMIKLMSKTNVDPSSVKMFDIDITKDEDFHRLYLESRNNMLATPRVTRVSHVISGFYSEISAYSEYDLISVNRNLAMETDYVRQQTLIYNSIFSHVMYTSFKKNATFDEWSQALLLPDINSLFFGVYDSNYPGENEYNLECGNCGGDIFVRVDNDDLYCYINKRLDKDYVKNLVKLDTQKMLSNNIKEDLVNKTFRKRLPNTGIIVEYGMPSLDTYLKTISALQQVFNQNNTNIDIANIDDPNSPVYGMLRIYLYIKGLGVPVKGKPTKENGPIPIRYVSVKDRAQLVAIISSLNRKDFAELFIGKEIKDLASVYGVSYFIKDVHCENCGIDLQPVLLEPQQVFFSKLGDETNNLHL